MTVPAQNINIVDEFGEHSLLMEAKEVFLKINWNLLLCLSYVLLIPIFLFFSLFLFVQNFLFINHLNLLLYLGLYNSKWYFSGSS